MNQIPQNTGIGLRQPHYQDILEQKPSVGFLEAHSENYFSAGGPNLYYLEKAAEIYPISLHGVGLSLGSADGLNKEHLTKLKKLVDYINPFLVSDHISWSHTNGVHIPDLLPVPYTEEALDIICTNIDHMQNELGRQILAENPSSYLAFKESAISEVGFLKEIVARTNCRILLDLNNILVSEHNINLDAAHYLNEIPTDIVGEIHLAGYHTNVLENGKEVRIDTHGYPVYDELWDFYRTAIQKLGPVPTLIEWDTDIPELDTLVAEAKKADVIQQEASQS